MSERIHHDPQHFTDQRLQQSLSPEIPDQALATHAMWKPQVSFENGITKEVGAKTPDGDFYPFHHGERFSLVRDGSSLKPIVRLTNGQEVAFQVWRAINRQEIIQMLGEADSDYQRVFIQLLNDYPDLDQIEIIPGTAEHYPELKYTGGFWLRPTEDYPFPAVVVKVGGLELYQQLMTDREISAHRAAGVLGVSFEELRTNPKILKLFIFLHELGHVEDFIANYAKNHQKNEDPNYDPVAENRTHRKKEMDSLPVAGWSPITVKKLYDEGKLASFYEQNRNIYQSYGIDSPEQLIAAHERAYRELPSEEYADEFAAAFLISHWEKLGLGPRNKNHSTPS